MDSYDQPYDQATDSRSSQTQPIDSIIKEAIDAAMRDLHTWLPSQIVAVNGNQSVDIQPLLKRKYKDGTVVDLPVIRGVMVIVPRGQDYWVKLPIAVGDTGIALFCERSLDNWSVSGGSVDPQDTRTHDLSDPVFIPGLNPASEQVTGDATDLVIHNGIAEIQAKKDGTFKVKNNTNELLDLLSQTLQAIIDMRINTMLGPQQAINFAVFTLLKTKLDTLKG